MKAFILSVSFFLLIISGSYKEKPAYLIFDKNGKEVKYNHFIKGLSEADVILFGELHNNPIAHWMELTITKELYEADSNVTLGAEMFETDDQLLMDEYLKGLITESNFEKESKLWNNYSTDYKPLVVFAASKNIDFIATNVPRRYAGLVSRKGLDALNILPEQSKAFLPPLPIVYDAGLPGYKKMRETMGDHGKMGGPSNPDFLSQAQALKDATMSFNILKNRLPGYRFIHFNGSYHSNNFDGIYWYLKQADPSINIITINIVEQDDPENLDDEHINSADYIITTPSDMTKTY